MNRTPDLPKSSSDAKAKSLVVLLGLLWGWNWVATKIALAEITPWGLRAAGLGLGTITLFSIARWRSISLAIPRGRCKVHIFVAALLNIVGCNMLSAFAQLGAPTSRVVIIVYTMPIWATLMAALTLREPLTPARLVALGLCVSGLAILIKPLLVSGVPPSMIYAVAAAMAWAAGTVYLKWAHIAAHPVAITTVQLAIGTIVILFCGLMLEGLPSFFMPRISTVVAVVYTGLIGLGLAYLLWFDVIARLPAIIAAIGALLVPVAGIVFSALILGERPSSADLIGFSLIFAAAAGILLMPGRRASVDRVGKTRPASETHEG